MVYVSYFMYISDIFRFFSFARRFDNFNIFCYHENEKLYKEHKEMSKVNLTEYAESDITIRDINCIYIQRMTCAWKHTSTFESYHRLVFIGEGDFTASIDGQTMHVKKHDLLYIPKNARYQSSSLSVPFCHTTILFDFAQSDRNSYPFSYLYTLKSPEKFMQMFDDILNVWLYRSFGYKLKTKMLLYDILRNMLMEHMIQGNMLHSYNTIQAAMQFIDRNYDKEYINVEELAKMCGITPTHFTRVFKGIYMTTPVKYINKLRIDRAIELLEHTTLTVNEIAEQTGFSDTSYFSKMFKKLLGKSPLHYRQEM